MKRTLVGLFAGIFLLIFGAFGVFFYTAVPLNFVASLVTKSGFQFEGLDGSIATGYQFSKLTYNDEYSELLMQDVNIQYMGFWDAFFNKKIVYDDVMIGRAELKMKKPRPAAGSRPVGTAADETVKSTTAVTTRPSLGESTPSNQEKMAKTWEELKQKWKAGEIIQEFAIRRLSFTNLKLSSYALPFPVEMKVFKIDDLNIYPQKATLGEMKIVSTFFDIHAKALEASESGVKMGQPLSGAVKMAATMLGLKRDLNFKASLTYENGAPSGEITLMDEKLQMKLSSALMLSLEARDLTLGEYFKGAPPIMKLNLQAPPTVAMAYPMGAVPFQGDFMLADQRFIIQPRDPNVRESSGFFTALAENGPEKYEAAISPNITLASPVPQPWIRLRSNLPMEPQQLLAHFYLKKDPSQLTPEETALLGEYLPHYQTGLPIQPVLVMKGKPASKVVATKNSPPPPPTAVQKPNRAPASVQAPAPVTAPVIAPSGRLQIFNPKTIPKFKGQKK